MKRALIVGMLGALAMGMWACSSEDDKESGGGEACGITCDGAVTCSSSVGVFSGSATVKDGACVFTADSSSATLSCDNKGKFVGPGGSGDGTWSGGGTSVTMNDPDGVVFTCTIQPPSSGTGGSGGGIGGSGGGTSGSGGGTSGSGGGAGDCEGCIESQCMSEAQTCGSNAQCAGLLNCLAECEDDACQSGCESTYSEGVAPLNAYLECVFTKCESACSG
jgi:hypothetical protein